MVRSKMRGFAEPFPPIPWAAWGSRDWGRSLLQPSQYACWWGTASAHMGEEELRNSVSLLGFGSLVLLDCSLCIVIFFMKV